jgi:glycosyltransferase involved in cell wall biosynthesis
MKTVPLNGETLVSVIIIFFNAKRENFFEEAIESVISQTYENWELLLVDDGSTDGSTDIALQYSQKYLGRVRYLEHEKHQNRGMSATRNLGIHHAKGNYVAFLDADDVWLPQNLERYLALLNAEPKAGMLYGNTQYWYNWAGNHESIQQDFCDQVAELTGQPNTLFYPPNLLTIFLKNGGAVPCTCSLMVKRDLLKAIGGFEESFRGLYEDQVFYAKVCLEAPVFVTSECWSKYRRHPNSCCSLTQDTKQEYDGRLLFLNWLEQDLTKKGFKTTEVWQALQSQLNPDRRSILTTFKKGIQYLKNHMQALVQ